MASNPDYYKILEIADDATDQQVRDAYKKAALKHHPDRVPVDSPERPARTKRFQEINDAYFVLSNASRRADYNRTRPPRRAPGGFASSSAAAGDDIPEMPGSFWEKFGFGQRPTEDEQFGSVFEEMMQDETVPEDGQSKTNFWAMIGAASGLGLGFIIANFAGAAAGVAAGYKLGGIRDKKGKSVYAVYQELPQADKARLLSEMAAKVFAQAVGS